jgi:hypothetical protein
VEGGAVEALARSLTSRTDRLIERADALVEMQGKSTLQTADMERAIEEIDSSGTDGKEQNPEQVFEVIDQFGVEQLAELARRIERSLE